MYLILTYEEFYNGWKKFRTLIAKDLWVTMSTVLGGTQRKVAGGTN